MAEETLAVLSTHNFPQLVHSAAEAEAALDRIRQARLADAELNMSPTAGSEIQVFASQEASRG